MKKVTIKCNGIPVTAQMDEYNTHIIDSYRIKNKSDMTDILEKLRLKVPAEYAVRTRGMSGMIKEWRVHNMLYDLHILRDRTGSVDLNTGVPKWAKIMYGILSPLYFHYK